MTDDADDRPDPTTVEPPGNWSVFREYESRARQALAGGRRHLYEARMKADERAGKTYDG